MPPFFSNKKLIILLSSLILLVALLGYSLRERKLTWPEQFVNDTVGWFEFVFNRPAQYVAGFFENIQQIENVYQENKILKSHLDQFAEVSVQKQILERENKQLKQLLNLDKDPSLTDYKKHVAVVIDRSFDQWNQLISVNKGAQAGIKPGMAVITANGGFIGKVEHVSQFTSNIALISDLTQNTQISANVVTKDNPVFGMIEGYDPKQKMLLMKKMPIDAKIKKGQEVYTSGLGNVFPKGLVIGKIASVTPDQYGLTLTAYVQPTADLYNLDHVVIVESLVPTVSNTNK